MSVNHDHRIGALDGLRGFLTILVLLSHFFSELPGGTTALALGWIAVDSFFVLSGFLVGRLMIDKGNAANFLKVFYTRRILRTFPIYMVCIALSLAIFSLFEGSWTENDRAFSPYVYFTFTQNLKMASDATIGAHWLSPTWTLAVEEQFYLVAPVVMLLLSGRTRLAVLAFIAAMALVFRAHEYSSGALAVEYLPLAWARADSLAVGLIAACLSREYENWCARYSRTLLTSVLVILVLVILLAYFYPDATLPTYGHTLISIAAAAFLIAIVNGIVEAQRLDKAWLRNIGNMSFAIYLTHMPILWLAHGIVLDEKPSLLTISGFGVTLFALPLTGMVSWVLTKVVEEPITAVGRRFRWKYNDVDPKSQTRLGSLSGT